MTDYLVTGIAPTSDTTQIAQLLGNSSLQNERLSIVTKTDANSLQHEDHHGAGRSLSQSSTIMTGSGGTSVPGVGRGGASLLSGSHGAVPDFLGGLPLIPADQAQHFNIAISEGRGLVTYKATPEEAASVEAAFRQAGLRNVKVFKPKETIPSG